MSSVATRSVSAPSTEKPTRVRYGVLGFACSLSMITYLDRVCFGAAATFIIKDLGLVGEEPLAYAFSAFALSYAAFEVPTGWLGDVYGPRRTLIRIVLWWSLFTALTGMVGMSFLGGMFTGIAPLVVIRFLFGIGEAGAYPNITRALHNWFPFQERGFTQGMVWMSGRLMGGLTPLVWGLLVAGITTTEVVDGKVVEHVISKPLVEWREAFWIFGGIGLVWCVLFGLWFRNRPEEKPGVNDAELALITAGNLHVGDAHAGVPWAKLLSSTNLWLLCLMYFCAAYGWYFNITYLPKFLEQTFEVSPSSAVGWIYKGGPLWLGAAGCLIGGFLTDFYIRRTGNRRFGRRLFGLVGHSLCAISYFMCIYADTAFEFFMAISLAAFFNDLTMGASWATCQDIGQKYAAIVAGCMNTIGNLGGAVAGIATGRLISMSVSESAAKLGVPVTEMSTQAYSQAYKVARLAGYNLNFMIFAAVYVVAVFCWLKIDSTKPVAE